MAHPVAPGAVHPRLPGSGGQKLGLKLSRCGPTLLSNANYSRREDPFVNRNVSSAKLLFMSASGAGNDKNAAPFADLDRTEVADRLHSAAIHLLRHARAQDVLSGQGPARLSALSVLIFAGPMTLGKLAAAEQVKPPTMSRIVEGLRHAGLARVDGDPKDARRIHISATPKGQKLLQRARERRIHAIQELLGTLSDREMGLLRDAAEIIENSVRGQKKA